MASAAETNKDVLSNADNFNIGPESWVNRSGYDLLTSGRFSDCEIKVASKTIKLHRNILAAACPYFETALAGSFKEATEQCIDWTTEEEVLVEALLRYIYGCRYPSVLPNDANLNTHVRLYSFADRLLYQPLKDAASSFLIEKTTKIPIKEITAVLNTIDGLSLTENDDMHKVAVNCVRGGYHELVKLPNDTKMSLSRDTPMLGGIMLDISIRVTLKGEEDGGRNWYCNGCAASFRVHTAGTAGRTFPHCCPACGNEDDLFEFPPVRNRRGR
ncbi:BTB/POZ protein [Elsinoe ampelina]|uniref:BTB/POZ protein n=1 Tax=Elsinoe ampelina TaxID=302913 RepID=A0A6A6G9E2_9PEZI|nr:BTB/POZ protein [Elsinoe ampelina]